jgi:hypothetical protein
MSIRAIPLIVIAFILYNVMIMLGHGTEALNNHIFTMHMMSGGDWTFTWGDLIILITLFLLFIEIVKSTYTSTSTLIDHGLSMVVFIACLIEFLLVKQAAHSVFFIILVSTLIDVIAGYTIGIRVARRDLSIGANQ